MDVACNIPIEERGAEYGLLSWTLRFFMSKMTPNPVLAREIPTRTKNS